MGDIFTKAFWDNLVFLLAVGGMFLAMNRIDRSAMPDRKKRLLSYALLAGIAILAIVIFRWHSVTYMATGL